MKILKIFVCTHVDIEFQLADCDESDESQCLYTPKAVSTAK